MPATHRNRLVTAISNTPGTTGALTIAAAALGYRTFGASDNGLSFDVSIVDGTSWEIRTGCVYTHSGTSLSRGTLEDSSTGSAISFTSAAVVTVTMGAGLGNLLTQQTDRAQTIVTGDGTTTQTFGAVTTKIAAVLTTVVANPRSEWNATNKKLTPNRAGNYLCFASLEVGASSAQLQVNVFKNGAVAIAGAFGAAGTYIVCQAVGIVYCNGTTDYLEMYGYQSVSGAVAGQYGPNNFISFMYLG